MTVNKNKNLDSSKKTKSYLIVQKLLEFDKNVFIGFGLLIYSIYLIDVLTRPDISQEIQGFLVVIIGLLFIVAIDFFKKDTNSESSNFKIPYPRIENNHVYNYSRANIYQNGGNLNYSSKENLEEVAAEIKEIIEKVSKNKTDSDIEKMPILEAKLIEEIKDNAPETTKNLTNKDLSIVARTIETIEQDQSLKQRISDILKTGKNEVETLKQFLDAPSLTNASSSFIITYMQNRGKKIKDVNNSDIKHQNENFE